MPDGNDAAGSTSEAESERSAGLTATEPRDDKPVVDTSHDGDNEAGAETSTPDGTADNTDTPAENSTPDGTADNTDTPADAADESDTAPAPDASAPEEPTDDTPSEPPILTLPVAPPPAAPATMEQPAVKIEPATEPVAPEPEPQPDPTADTPPPGPTDPEPDPTADTPDPEPTDPEPDPTADTPDPTADTPPPEPTDPEPVTGLSGSEAGDAPTDVAPVPLSALERLAEAMAADDSAVDKADGNGRSAPTTTPPAAETTTTDTAAAVTAEPAPATPPPADEPTPVAPLPADEPTTELTRSGPPTPDATPADATLQSPLPSTTQEAAQSAATTATRTATDAAKTETTEPQPTHGPPTPQHLKPGPDRARPAHAAPKWSGLERVLEPVRALPLTAQVGGAVLACLLLLLVVSGVDGAVVHGSQVQRNVEVGGSAVGGLSSDGLDEAVAALAAELESRPVSLSVDGEAVDVELTPEELGVTVDRDASAAAAWDAGRDVALPLRPFEWVGSLFSERTVEVAYEVDGIQAFARINEVYETAMDDGQVTAAVDPQVQLEGGEFVAAAGVPGRGLDPQQVIDDLQATMAATESTPGSEIVLEVETTELAPAVTDTDAEGLAEELNHVTAPLTLEVEGAEQELSTEQLRSWITPVVSPEDMGWELDVEAARTSAAELFGDLSQAAVNARPQLVGNEVEIVPSENGRRCCTEDTGERVRAAMEAGDTTVALELENESPEYSTEDLEAMGIVEPVGGNRGWQAGVDVEGPRPGFTTWEVGSGGRAHNIGLIAEEVNGAWIPPGGTWGINDHVGARECPPYHAGGAIVDGEHVDVCGGGISQFGTTMLNAAYFAGLDLSGFRAHSEYFSRYPRGREATMGAPGGPLDVVITNNTPYGIYIQSVRHDQELTVTMWSTQHIDVEQTGYSESSSGECTYVTTTRTRTYPDGTTEDDTFSGAYGPGGDVRC